MGRAKCSTCMKHRRGQMVVIIATALLVRLLFSNFEALSTIRSPRHDWLEVPPSQPLRVPGSPLALAFGQEKRIESVFTTGKMSYTREGSVYHLQSKAYMCTSKDGLSPGLGRAPLSPDLEGIFNVNVQISTDLNFLFVGDSVGLQLFESFAFSTGAFRNMTTLLTYGTVGPGVAVAAPVRGGGTLGFHRMLGLMRRKNEFKPPPNSGPGWNRNDTFLLLDHTSQHTQSQRTRLWPPIDGSTNTVNRTSVDVLVHRINHPWQSVNKIHNASLLNTVHVSSQYTDAEVFIYVTPYLNNNVETNEDVKGIAKMSREVRQVVEAFEPDAKKSNVKFLMMLDMHVLVEGLIRHNAKALGYNVTEADDYSFFLTKRLKSSKSRRPFSRKVAMDCVEDVPNLADNCTNNMLFFDGMHFCMETVGIRTNAAIACLVECAYHPSKDIVLRECERGCNGAFLAVQPVKIAL